MRSINSFVLGSLACLAAVSIAYAEEVAAPASPLEKQPVMAYA